jgi:Tfp pilus assembly protein PilN
MINKRTALGIDISASQISCALVGHNRRQLVLLKSACAPVPDGAVEAGNIKNPALIARAVKDLCSRNKIAAHNIVVSLLSKPAVLRIIDLPRDLTMTPAKYIHEEFKHYAVLAGKTAAHDFCALPMPKNARTGRILAAAGDEEKIVSLVRAFNRVGLYIKAIEPGALAASRALYKVNVARKFGINSMFVFIQDSAATFTVFKDMRLDFIRTVVLADDSPDSPDFAAALIEEIAGVRQFYDLECEESPRKWEILVAPDRLGLDLTTLAEKIKGACGDASVSVCGAADLARCTGVAGETGQASIAAIGLAMKLADNTLGELKLNLLPARSDEVHNLQKFSLLTSGSAIAVFLLMLLIAPLVDFKIDRTKKSLTACQGSALGTLLSKQKSLAEKETALSDQIVGIQKLVSTYKHRDWAALFSELSRRTPGQVRITNILTRDEKTLIISGQSISNEEVHLFAKLLAASPQLAGASLVKTEVDPASSRLILYTISCTLPPVKEEAKL